MWRAGTLQYGTVRTVDESNATSTDPVNVPRSSALPHTLHSTPGSSSKVPAHLGAHEAVMPELDGVVHAAPSLASLSASMVVHGID